MEPRKEEAGPSYPVKEAKSFSNKGGISLPARSVRHHGSHDSKQVFLVVVGKVANPQNQTRSKRTNLPNDDVANTTVVRLVLSSTIGLFQTFHERMKFSILTKALNHQAWCAQPYPCHQ